MSKLLLTIDDGFSVESKNLIKFLADRKIGAVLFCIGNTMTQPENVETARIAINNGYLIGNHSFSHICFALEKNNSKIRYEIEETEKRIDRLYQMCGKPRPSKVFRYPFALKTEVGKAILASNRFKNPFSSKDLFWSVDAGLKDGSPMKVETIKRRVDECMVKIGENKKPLQVIGGHDCVENIRLGLFETLLSEVL